MSRGFYGMQGSGQLGCGEWAFPNQTTRMSAGSMQARPLTLSRGVLPEVQPPREQLSGKTLSCSACELKKKQIEEERRRRGMAGPRRALGACGKSLGQACPLTQVPPGMNCQATADGNLICSNGVVYAGGCPYAPQVNYPGVAMVVAGAPVPPPAPGAAATPLPASSAAPVATPALVPATPTNNLLAVGGGILSIGLLVALLS